MYTYDSWMQNIQANEQKLDITRVIFQWQENSLFCSYIECEGFSIIWKKRWNYDLSKSILCRWSNSKVLKDLLVSDEHRSHEVVKNINRICICYVNQWICFTKIQNAQVSSHLVLISIHISHYLEVHRCILRGTFHTFRCWLFNFKRKSRLIEVKVLNRLL